MWSLGPDDDLFVSSTARGRQSALALALLVLSFRRLGRFVPLVEVPVSVVDHVRRGLRLAPLVEPVVSETTLYRHHRLVREFLGVHPWGVAGRHVAVIAVRDSALSMNNPADLINVAIEALLRERFELPAFRALDELARWVRSVVNQRIYATVAGGLDDAAQLTVDGLLDVGEGAGRSWLHRLKQQSRRPTVSHLGALVTELEWLDGLGCPDRALAGVPPAKIAQFAAEAWVLDASELRHFTPARRATVVLCLLAPRRARVRDDLVEMFCKLMARVGNRARDQVAATREALRATTEELVNVLSDVLVVAGDSDASDGEVGARVRALFARHGGIDRLLGDIDAVSAFHGDDPLVLMWQHFRSHRQAMFRLARALTFIATSADRSLLDALDVLLDGQARRGDWMEPVDLSFASDAWQRLILDDDGDEAMMDRRQFEVCVFVHLADQIRSGDVAIDGSLDYADWRAQLLTWEQCEPEVAGYCAQLGLPVDADAFIAGLQELLAVTARDVDRGYPTNDDVMIDDDGNPVLRRPARAVPSPAVEALEAAVFDTIDNFTVLDALAATRQWCGWDRHFGSLSGSDAKLDDAATRYLGTTFAYGTNLGPAQASRHMPGISAHMLGFINRRHITAAGLDAANRDVIGLYARCALPAMWGNPALAAADGSKYDLSRDSLIAEYHIRYGGWGGIAYRHVSDTYIALFTRFVPCGVSEAIYVLDGLLANTSVIQPDTVHTDTHGQSTPVFGLSYLLGIKLMPRIRNWKALRLYRPEHGVRYEHIDSLFSDTINWDRIRTHHRDLLQVVLSIRAGRITTPILLRRLGSYSRRNRLYQAFQELGRVIRTVLLLRWLSELELRVQVTATTNKVEAFHGFAKWLFFGGDGTTIGDGDPDELEKRVKYNDLVANCVALYTVVAISRALRHLHQHGHPATPAAIGGLSPFITRPVKCFGDYTIPDDDPTITFDGDRQLSPTTTSPHAL